MAREGSRIVVHGVSSGIGAAVAHLLADEGATVLGVDRTVPLEDPNGGFVQCDLGEEDSLSECVRRLPDRIDGLANVAGLPGTVDAAAIGRVNFLGLRYLTEMRHPRIETGGSVVHVASIAGAGWQGHTRELADLIATPDFEAGLKWWSETGPRTGPEAYAFSKEAVIYYAKTRAQAAWSAGYRVNTVSPGATVTPILRNFSEYMPIEWSETVLGRHATAEDIAGVVAFLLAPHSSFVNGVDVVVDGGLMAGLLTGTVPGPS
jgi:NAD(P)-dependent dehydrogenase (short-subunit alcohol dehydrogenase family)